MYLIDRLNRVIKEHLIEKNCHIKIKMLKRNVIELYLEAEKFIISNEGIK